MTPDAPGSGTEMANQRIGEVLGAWRLEELIGSGGMSEVYRARRIDGVVTQTVAVKVLRAADGHGFPDEADVLRLLSHQNIAWIMRGARKSVLTICCVPGASPRRIIRRLTQP